MTIRTGDEARVPRERGFTLIEVMIALIIFATGMLALALCVPMATNRVMKAGTQTRASALGSEMAEELLTVPYGDGDLTAGTHDDPANPHSGNYYIRWVVEDDVPTANCKRITVKVARLAAGNPPASQIVIVSAQAGG
jgi:type IV pilus modification protein PilV